MKIISNASPLIFLAKINRLDLLADYELTIPKQVYEDIIKGEETGKEDSQKIKTLAERSIIKVEEVEIDKELEKQNLGNGEKAAISLAIGKKTSSILLDERKARKIAKFYKLKPRGIIGLLVEAYKNNKINKKELNELIKKLIEEGYRINEILILELLKELG